MQINISTRHGHLSAASQEKINEKLAKLKRFHERVTAVELIADVQHPESPHVEVRVSIEKAADCVATDTATSLMAAVDGVIHKLEQQLRKHNEKVKGHRTPGHRHVEPPTSPEVEAE